MPAVIAGAGRRHALAAVKADIGKAGFPQPQAKLLRAVRALLLPFLEAIVSPVRTARENRKRQRRPGGFFAVMIAYHQSLLKTTMSSHSKTVLHWNVMSLNDKSFSIEFSDTFTILSNVSFDL